MVYDRTFHIKVLDFSLNFGVLHQMLADLKYVLTEGPWVISNQYLVVQKWRPNFIPGEDAIQKMPVWVRLSKLPMEWIEVELLRNIGGMLGNTIKVDPITESQARGRFARICVEIDITKPLQSSLNVEDRVVMVEYESLGLLCFKCGKVGHYKDTCREGLVPQSDQGRNAEQGKGLDSSVNEPYGPWMQVTYGRNARYFGSGTAGKRGNFQSQGGKNGSGMKYGNGPLSQEQHGVDMAGSNEGNNVGVSKVSVGVDKKKIGNKPKSGSRFSVLNEEVLEENSVKPSHNDTNRQGKNQSEKVLSEISNRKPPNRNQVSKSSSSYLVENNGNKSYFCKPLKENSSEVLSKKDGKGHIKDSRLLPNDSSHGMDEVIEDSVVLQSLHSEIMDLENSVGREGIKDGEVSSTVEKVILSEASNIEEVASKLKEAMDIALV
ncbi:hypothetical protein LWI29_032918 [Acer saccharum]|uniref:CCHC-type domain-containing protein n=1 Tax=Acer saccharum TaxID=4024 RepID=A0AA39VHR1_ACESA|nr:hypothetical protein LWI29_032918 [Acer saccharum]